MAGFKGYKRSIILDFSYDQVKKGVPDVNRQMALLNAEYRKSQAEIGKTGSSFEKLALAQEKLSITTKLQADKVAILKKELDVLTKAEGNNEKAIDRKTIELKNAETQYIKTNEQLDKVNKELDKQTKELGTVKGKWNDLVEQTRASNPEFDKAADSLKKTTAAVVAIGTGAAVASMNFDKAMGQVRVLADETQVPVHKLREGVLDLSRDINISAGDLAESLGTVLSSNIETADSINVLTDAGKLAKAGNAEVTATVDVLTGAINAYGLEVGRSKDLSDKLIITQKLGKLELNELGQGFGRVATLAATANVPIEEVYAALASLTTGGMNTSEAITTLNAMLTNVVKPTGEVAKKSKELGVNFSLAGIQSKGLAGFLTDLNKRTNGSQKALTELFGSSKAAAGALRLSGEGAELFAKALDEMESSVGVTDEALGKLQDNGGERFSSAMNEMKVSLIEIGDTLSPVIDMVATLISWVSKIPAPVMVAVGVGLIVFKTMQMISIMLPVLALNSAMASGGLAALGISGGIAVGPMLLIAAAIGLVVGLLAIMAGNAGKAKREMKEMADATQSILDGAMGDAQKQAKQTTKKGYAIGTNYAEGGWATVGEHGPERMYVPRGSKVYDSGATRSMEKQEQQSQNASNQAIVNKLDQLINAVAGVKQEVYNMPQRQQAIDRMGTVRG